MNWNHEMMDDTAEWAVNRWIPFIPAGCDQQGRLTATVDQRQGKHEVDTKKPMPAEACTSFGFEDQSNSADDAVFPVLLVAMIGFIAVVAWGAAYV